MVPLGQHSTTRVAITFALLAAASLSGGSTELAPLYAQELPAGVAADLVDRALERQLEAPSAASTAGPRDWTPAALSWVAMGLALVTLLIGWMRGELKIRPSQAAETQRREYVPGSLKPAAYRPGRWKKVTSDHAPKAVEPPSRPEEARPKASPELVLPSHVTSILERAAIRRREEALAAEREAEEMRPAAAAPDADPATESLDFVVPGFDPWKGQ